MLYWYLRFDRRWKCERREIDYSAAWTVRGIVHLFIGAGRSPYEITSMSLITNYDHNTDYQGLYIIFLFKSVSSFVFSMTLSRSSFDCSFGLYLHVVPAFILSCRRCFFPRGPSAEKKTPTITIFILQLKENKESITILNIQ
jgi:hypothetical protein